jgi:AcrR family transcriptional regulator
MVMGRMEGVVEVGRSRRRDPEAVRQDILAVARAEFVENGLSGARVDEIAARTATSKRMIYYYYGDKEGLYLAVLEECYRRVREAELGLDHEIIPPVEAMRRLAGLAFDYHAANPDFVRLVMVENIHHARLLKRSKLMSELNLSAIRTVERIYRRGVAEGVFRDGLDPLDIHLTFTAPAFYNVSNRATILQVFGHDMADSDAMNRRRASVIDAVMRFVAR